jgi:hypothetical protein
VSGALAPSVRPTRALGIYAFIFGVAAVAALSGVAALVLAVRGRTDTAAAPPAAKVAPSQLDRPVIANFGVVSVDQFVKLRRPNGGALRGLTGRREAVQVAVTLTNLRDSPLTLSARMFRLRVDTAGPAIAATVWNLPDTVRRQSARKVLLRYVVPSAESLLTLAIRADGRRPPVLIALGRADAAPVIPLNVDLHVSNGTHH